MQTTDQPAGRSSCALVDPEGLAMDDAAAFLNVGESTVKTWDRDQLMPAPALRIGRVVRWSRRELTAWLLAGSPTRPRWESIRERELKRTA